MSNNNLDVDSKRHYVLTSLQEYEAYMKRQQKPNLNFVKPDFSKLFGDDFK
jgi:hypothetical protein